MRGDARGVSVRPVLTCLVLLALAASLPATAMQWDGSDFTISTRGTSNNVNGRAFIPSTCFASGESQNLILACEPRVNDWEPLYVVRMQKDGTRLDPNGRLLNVSIDTSKTPWFGVCTDGHDYYVVYNRIGPVAGLVGDQPRYADLVRVTPEGAVSAPVCVDDCTLYPGYVNGGNCASGVATNGASILVASHIQYTTLPRNAIGFVLVDAAGNFPLIRRVLADQGGTQFSYGVPSVGTDGTNYLIAYRRSDGYMRTALVDGATGVLLGSRQLAAANSSVDQTWVRFHAGAYHVWWSGETVGTYMMRVGTDGVPLDAAPRHLTARCQHGDFDGHSFFAAEDAGDWFRLYRLAPDFSVLETLTLPDYGYYQGLEGVYPQGNRLLTIRNVSARLTGRWVNHNPIYNVSPISAENTAPVRLSVTSVTGTPVDTSWQVTLVLSDGTPVPGTDITIDGTNQLSATFDIIGGVPGPARLQAAHLSWDPPYEWAGRVEITGTLRPVLPAELAATWLTMADEASAAIEGLPGTVTAPAAELHGPAAAPGAPTPPGGGASAPYAYLDWAEMMAQTPPTLPARTYTALRIPDGDGNPTETLVLRTRTHSTPVQSTMVRPAEVDDVVLECVEMYWPGGEGVRGPDTTPPEIQSATVTPLSLEPPDGRMVPIALDMLLADTDNALVERAATWYVEDVTCSDPNATGEGETPDWVIDPDNLQSLHLRAGPNERSYLIAVRAIDGSGNLCPEPVTLVVEVPTMRQMLADIIAEMQAIVDANPGTPLAAAVCAALTDAQAALAALNASPADAKAAGSALKKAIGDLTGAVDKGLLAAEQGNGLMWDLCEVARALAVAALNQAIEREGNDREIAAGQRLLAEGDLRRVAGKFGEAISKYNEALNKAEAALKGGVDWTQITTLHATPTDAGAQVVFTLSADAQVTATVLNIAGRPIRRLCAERACTAGVNTLLWNARADSGLMVPGGAYLIQVEARGTDGSRSQAVTRLNLLR